MDLIRSSRQIRHGKLPLLVLKALEYLHSKNIVHGDLKGANVLCKDNGEVAKLCDLGNSLQLQASLTSVNSIAYGTLAWMAPEA